MALTLTPLVDGALECCPNVRTELIAEAGEPWRKAGMVPGDECAGAGTSFMCDAGGGCGCGREGGLREPCDVETDECHPGMGLAPLQMALRPHGSFTLEDLSKRGLHQDL